MKTFLLVCALGALSGCMTSDAGTWRLDRVAAGCLTYGVQRLNMPTLADDAVGRWVDVLDGAMTATCR